MANEMTSPAPDVVQCPVCFKDFKPATINGHLDVCLLENVTDTGPSTNDDGGPPVKKSRISAEAAPRSPSVNKPERSGSSSMAATQPPAVFSLFQGSKSKVSVQSERSGLLTGKQSAAPAVNKGGKRSLQNEAEPGPAGAESLTSASAGQTLKASHDLSSLKLLTMDKPLAEILRPNTLEEYFGQSKVVGQQTLLRSLLDSQEIPSLILWGPPGCGKVMMQHPCPFISNKTQVRSPPPQIFNAIS